MAHVPPDSRDAFGSDLLAAMETTRCSIVPATQSDQANLFAYWVAFCAVHGHRPFLDDVPPSLHLDFLIVFGCCYHHGLINCSAQPVRSKWVAEALRTMGQEFARLDLPDPRMDSARYIYQLGALFKAWDDEDPAPSQVWPVNLTILRALGQRLQDHPEPS